MYKYIKLIILSLLIIVFSIAMLYCLQYIGAIFGLSDKTGPIGDSIGGSLGPIIAFFSCILMYLAFDEQTKANEITRKQFEDERSKNDVDRLYEFIVTGIKDFKYQKSIGTSITPKNEIFEGVIGIEKLVRDVYCGDEIHQNPDFVDENNAYIELSARQLEGILTISNTLLDKLNQNSQNYYFCSLKIILNHLLNTSIFEWIKSSCSDACENWNKDLKKKYCDGCKCDHGFNEYQITLLCEVQEKLNLNNNET